MALSLLLLAAAGQAANAEPSTHGQPQGDSANITGSASQRPSATDPQPATGTSNPCTATDNASGPAMVTIRPGRFTMGSPENETGRSSDESPQHDVTIPRPFALSRCEISVGQFRQFIADSGYRTTAESDGKGCYVLNSAKKQGEQLKERNWADPGFDQTDDHPVVCVSWQDAQHYVEWLSQRTGALYRLPSEAEWEYAARADSKTARYFDPASPCQYANGLGQEAKSIADPNWTLAECPDGYVYTAPVGRFAANAFGLYDVLGNVWEWTLDCWHEDYTDAPDDGSGWLEANGRDCGRRVVRGGSWLGGPLGLRSANRSRNDTDAASSDLGFRVARAL